SGRAGVHDRRAALGRRRAAPARGAGERRGRRAVLVGADSRANRESVRAGALVRVVYMAKAKRSAARALDWLAVEGAEVVAVVAGEPDELTHEDQRVDLV